ncbi:hypothetical protein [Gilvibacter sp.]|uniref:hypothetical protein n=1 Tax=Gilvibacter sp. TaxID=2729997 RepID=UPI003F4A0388
MMRQFLFLTALFLTSLIHAQSYYNGRFTIETYSYGDRDFTLYDMSRASIDSSGAKIGAKYFATGAYDKFLEWKVGKEVLLITSGAYLDGWDTDAKPVGLSVDNGEIINRSARPDMDGLVLFYNGAAQEGGIAVVDMDKKYVNIEYPAYSGNYEQLDPRETLTDRSIFLNAAVDLELSVWQAHLVYSEKKTEEENFSNKYYGNERERRYLAITVRDNEAHHIVVDVPESIKLLEGADDVKSILEYIGHEVLYILNLETGSLNLLHATNGSNLIDIKSNMEFNWDKHLLDNANSFMVWYIIK